MAATSAIAPCPISPQARRLDWGGSGPGRGRDGRKPVDLVQGPRITLPPVASIFEELAEVPSGDRAVPHPGVHGRGQDDRLREVPGRNRQVRKLSESPRANLARVLASSGATTSRSAHRRNSICKTGSSRCHRWSGHSSESRKTGPPSGSNGSRTSSAGSKKWSRFGRDHADAVPLCAEPLEKRGGPQGCHRAGHAKDDLGHRGGLTRSKKTTGSSQRRSAESGSTAWLTAAVRLFQRLRGVGVARDGSGADARWPFGTAWRPRPGGRPGEVLRDPRTPRVTAGRSTPHHSCKWPFLTLLGWV